MKRIILIVLRLLPVIPVWMLVQMPKYRKTENYSLEDRYAFIQKKIAAILKKARIEYIISGVENIPLENGYLITPNHQGLVDPLIIATAHKNPLRAIVKIELVKIPFVRDIVTILKCLPMDRKDVRGSVKIIREASNSIKTGETFVVFPEGTRSKNKNQLNEFKGGTYKIVEQAKCGILPVALIDCYKPFDENSMKKVLVKIHFLPFIPYESIKDMHTNDIAAMVQNQIQEYINDQN